MFLTRYYRILLEDENGVVLCAVDDDGQIVGFVSGTLDAAGSSSALREHKLSLALWAGPATIRKPSLLLGLRSRYKTLVPPPEASDRLYVSAQGARCSYWAVRRMEQSGIVAIALLRQWLAIMRSLGAGRIVLEVDEQNADVAKVHQLLGARESRRYVTPDGKSRRELYYPPEGARAA
jgi:hypothetical protein